MVECVLIFMQAYRQWKCNHSKAGIARSKRYDKSLKGKLTKLKYVSSPKGKTTNKLYIASGRKAFMQKENNLYLQDKYGYHRVVREWYPGARLIEALETAPIVEIKV